MPLVYITGISGSGKSAVRQELLKLHYEAHDADEDGFREWQDLKTGKFVYGLNLSWDEADEQFKKQHTLAIKPEKVAELHKKARDKIIFLCGTVPNDMDVWQYFSQVICLTVDDETLRHRIATRSDNNFGKAAWELADILKWNKTSEQKYRRLNTNIIDATQPLKKVVDEILSYVQAAKPEPPSQEG